MLPWKPSGNSKISFVGGKWLMKLAFSRNRMCEFVKVIVTQRQLTSK
jgi:hypothetical protein